MAAPIEGKVKAGTAAAAVSGLALFALGRYVFKGDVPDVVASWVYAIVPALITFAAGYAAKHTPRADDQLIAAIKNYGGDVTAPPAGPPPSVSDLHAPPVAPPAAGTQM